MDFAQARLKMVDNQIRTTDVTNFSILRAFLQVPREEFVPEDARPLAYIDNELRIADGRYLIEPAPLAKLLQLARVAPGDVVLDVGSGTGYAAAILTHLASSVVALEEDGALAAASSEVLSRLDYHAAAVVEGTLKDGYAPEAPYDVILFEGAIDAVPPVFFEQLKERGRLVAVQGSGLSAMAKLYSKEDGIVSDRFGFNCALRPLPGFRAARQFVF